MRFCRSRANMYILVPSPEKFARARTILKHAFVIRGRRTGRRAFRSRPNEVFSRESAPTPPREARSRAGLTGIGGCAFNAATVFRFGTIADVLHLSHGPAGCGHYAQATRRSIVGRTQGIDAFASLHLTSDFQEADVVFGGDRKLARCIEEMNTPFPFARGMSVISECPVGLIGDDVRAVAKARELPRRQAGHSPALRGLPGKRRPVVRRSRTELGVGRKPSRPARDGNAARRRSHLPRLRHGTRAGGRASVVGDRPQRRRPSARTRLAARRGAGGDGAARHRRRPGRRSRSSRAGTGGAGGRSPDRRRFPSSRGDERLAASHRRPFRSRGRPSGRGPDRRGETGGGGDLRPLSSAFGEQTRPLALPPPRSLPAAFRSPGTRVGTAVSPDPTRSWAAAPTPRGSERSASSRSTPWAGRIASRPGDTRGSPAISTD